MLKGSNLVSFSKLIDENNFNYCLFCCTGNGTKTTSTDDMLETENNRMVDELASKVSRLKGVR